MAKIGEKSGVVTMDSRKFLGAINSSQQAKIAHMEQCVRDLGQQAGSNWRLTSLNGDSLFFEDADSNTFYVASHHREKGGTVTIDNIRPIRIVESKKKSLFESSCRQLVDAIESNDQRGMAAAFNKMAGQKFTSRSVPLSGVVRTRDNVTRTIAVATESVLGEDLRPRLVQAIVEGLTNKVVMENGRPVRATYAPSNIKLPVSDWMCYRAVARQMRSIAEEAYWSNGFQDRIYDVAKMIDGDDIGGAVKAVSGFLAEEQEFTLLGRDKMRTLVENTMATKACFNDKLCEHVATLLWRTSLKVNRDAIIKEWRQTAKKASHPTLLENVQILENSPNFDAAYDKFLTMVFNEAVGPKDVQVHAYKTALTVLKDTPKIKESNELSGKIDELIERLEQPEADHAVISEVEDLLAEVKSEMNALESLDDFDKMPGGDDDNDLNLGGDDAPAGGTTVNFNININKDGVDVNNDAGDDEGAGDDDSELEELLGGGDDDNKGDDEEEEEGGGDDLASLLKGESRGRDEAPISEDDRYAYNKPAPKVGGIGADYGLPPIELTEDCVQVVRTMFKIAEHNGLEGKALLERAEDLATASMRVVGLSVPERRRDQAIEQVCDAFFDELDRRGVAIDEDQRKGPWRHVWGRKKSAINRRERTKSESKLNRKPVVESVLDDLQHMNINWLDSHGDSKLGEFGGINFVLDHGSSAGLEPVLISEDGQVEVPVPPGIQASALAAAEITAGDDAPFLEWLAGNIEQLRVLSDADRSDLDRSINEAVVTINTNQDGGLEVEVDSQDPDVMMTEPGEGMMPGDGLPGDDMPGDGVAGDMAPVDSMVPVEPEAGDETAVPGDMPDFDGGDSPPPPVTGDEGAGDDGTGEEEEEEAGEDDDDDDDDDEEEAPPPKKKSSSKKPPFNKDDDDEGVAEDRDITSPESSKYNTTKQDHRKTATAAKPGKADNNLDGFGDGVADTPGAKMKKIKTKKK